MLSKECRAQRVSSSQAGELRWGGAGHAGDQVQGFRAHKQPSPSDSRHISSGAASMELRLQPCRAQGIWSWNEMLCQALLRYVAVGKCYLYHYEVCVHFLKGLVKKETRRHQTCVYIKPFLEFRDVRYKLSLFILLNVRGNRLWFEFLAGQVK